MKLYDYQIKGRDFLLDHEWALLGDDMGLGKTLQAIAAMPLTGPKLVVCPAMLRNTWCVEIRKYADSIDWNVEAHMVVNNKHDYMKHANVIYVISYELLKGFPRNIHPKAIVFDECHYLKNLGAQRTKVAHDLVQRVMPEYLFLLSGTPIKNNCTEFYSVLKMLSYCPSGKNGLKVTEKSQYAFNLRFSNPHTRHIQTARGQIEVTEFKGIRNKEKLIGYLKGKYIRRKSGQVLDLPPIIDKEVVITARAKPHHKELVKAYLAHEKGEAGEKEHIMTIKIRNAMEKVQFSVQYALDIWATGEKVIVFTDHIDSAKAIYEKLMGTKGLVVEMIDGSVRASRRADIIEQFQELGMTDILVLTIQSCKEGLTLTKARNIIFNDIPWSYVDLQQARKRIHRVGQEHSCVIHYILSSDTDAWLKRKVMEKKRNLQEIL